ncbi:ribonuclease H-like domain-containing protein [Tanacetum coccineum]|uniref:Ribonuclease H-like domain-containing protein n=1 Tax=Tanacetum coccineum TaxID=301880 RepID=A0ABQ5HDL2_9ASTR
MSGEEPATQIAPVESPQMVSTVKLLVLKKGEYILWIMRMEQYLTNTDYSLWQVILNERKAKSILLLAIPDEYQLRFHGIKDAKTLWAAIKSRFGGNVESKKIQKNVLKQQFKNFTISDTEGLDKAYDMFQKLISLLEVHGAAVSNEDANQKFLRALPSSWNNVALIMRNKAGIDDLDIDDLYNNLKVLKADIKGSSGSSSNSQNMAFLSAEDTSSSNEVNTANGVSTASGHNSQGQASSLSYTDDLMFLFFANQSSGPQLECCCSGNALIVQDGLGYDWSYIAQEEPTEFALMAYTSNSSGSNIEANLEIVAYQLGLESVEAQLVVHQKNEVVYEEKIAILEFEVKEKSNDITRLKNQLDETLREKDELKAKLEQFETSSKNLTKLINSQISTKDKTSLGYGDQLNENDSSGSELFNSVFDSRSSDGDDNQTNDRFKKDSGYHVVPHPITGNYMPPLADISFAGLDDSVYRPTTNKTSASLVELSLKISYSRLIKDCDFHENRMAKKSVLQNTGKNTGQREIKPVWNNVQRINHQNKFVPSIVLTRSGKVQVSTAKKSSLRATASTSTFRQVNTATHTNRVNVLKLRTNDFHKSHSPIRRSFYKPTAPNTRISNEKVNTIRVNGVNIAGQIAVSTVKGNGVTAIKASAGCVWRPKMTDLNNGNLQQGLKNKGIFDSVCSRHMPRNKDFLIDYQDIDGGFVAFGGSARGGKITGKGKIRTDKLDVEDVFFVKELKFNLFSVSQMRDKKNSVLFTKTKCLVLSPNFKLLDASQVLLRVPRQSNMYSFDLKNVVPSRNLTCLFAKVAIDKSKLWHRRLGHVNFKTMNKLVKGNLVRGLPSKTFENDHTCVACQKGKQHKASCKAKLVSSIS